MADRSFDLAQTIASLILGLEAVFCNIWLMAGIHGLVFAFIIGIIGLTFRIRKSKFAYPLLHAFRKMIFLCLLLGSPGLIYLAFNGKVPSTGTFSINSLGYAVFWSMISLHLCAEQVNFEWFQQDKTNSVQ